MAEQTGTLDLRMQGLAPVQVTKPEMDFPTVPTGDEILGTAGPHKSPGLQQGLSGRRSYQSLL